MKEENINERYLVATLNDLRFLYKIFGSLKVENLETPETIYDQRIRKIGA